jgi:hypothetical protein
VVSRISYLYACRDWLLRYRFHMAAVGSEFIWLSKRLQTIDTQKGGSFFTLYEREDLKRPLRMRAGIPGW